MCRELRGLREGSWGVLSKLWAGRTEAKDRGECYTAELTSELGRRIGMHFPREDSLKDNSKCIRHEQQQSSERT